MTDERKENAVIEQYNDFKERHPEFCEKLEENPGCPFVFQITTNKADISWLKKYLRFEIVLTIIASALIVIFGS